MQSSRIPFLIHLCILYTLKHFLKMAIHLFLFVFASYKRIELLKKEMKKCKISYWFSFEFLRFMSIRLKSWFLLPNLLHLQKFKRKNLLDICFNKQILYRINFFWFDIFLSQTKCLATILMGWQQRKQFLKGFFLFYLIFHSMTFCSDVMSYLFSWCLHIFIS